MLLWFPKRSLVAVDAFSCTSEKKMHNLLYLEQLQQAKMAIFKLSSILKN